MWEDGRAFVDLAARQAALVESREAIEAARKVSFRAKAALDSGGRFLYWKSSLFTICPYIPGIIDLLSRVFQLKGTGPMPRQSEARCQLQMLAHVRGSLLKKVLFVFPQAMRKKLPLPDNLLAGPCQNHTQEFLSPEDYVAQDEIFKVCSHFHDITTVLATHNCDSVLRTFRQRSSFRAQACYEPAFSAAKKTAGESDIERPGSVCAGASGCPEEGRGFPE